MNVVEGNLMNKIDRLISMKDNVDRLRPFFEATLRGLEIFPRILKLF